MSIVHRITGSALYVGTLLVAWWLIAAASGQGSYDWANWVLGSLLGKLVLLGYTWALLHHMLGGFRHFMAIVEVEDQAAAQVLADGDPIIASGFGFRFDILPMPSIISRPPAV